MAEYNVGGFTFTDEESARLAAKELKAIEFVLSQLKNSDDETVLKLYNKMLSQNTFKTPVGLSFMEQLKENLNASRGEVIVDSGTETTKDTNEGVQKSKIKGKSSRENGVNEKIKNSKRIKTAVTGGSTEVDRLRRINRMLAVLSITLALCIVGMFYVNSTINSPTILNYEEEILNKYSTWEQELTEREEAVRTKERSLE